MQSRIRTAVSVAFVLSAVALLARATDQACGSQTPWTPVPTGQAVGIGLTQEDAEHETMLKLTGAAECASACDDGAGGTYRCTQRLNGNLGSGGSLVSFPLPQPFPAPALWMCVATAGAGAQYRSTCEEC